MDERKQRSMSILGTLFFGFIGLIGNTICFLVVCRFALPQHSFVQYLRALAIFDFLSLFYECLQSLNDLSLYLFSINLMNFRSSIVCKFYEYSNHTIILLACWTIVVLTFDRLILVCDPLSKQWPNFSRRICNSQCAKRVIYLLVFLSLLINVPHSIYQEWICQMAGHQNSAAFHGRPDFHAEQKILLKNVSNQLTCKCRLSPEISSRTLHWIVKWKIYVFHLFCYTLIPAIILIASNAGQLSETRREKSERGHINDRSLFPCSYLETRSCASSSGWPTE